MTTLDDVPPADLALVADVRGGQRDAFAELYRRYYGPALRFALSLTGGDEAQAQDVVAEAFARVLRATAQGGGSTVAFWPYLLAAIRREYLAELRRSGRVDLVDDADELDSPAPAEDEQVVGVGDPLVVSAFRRLPARWRAVLWHVEIQGDKPADLAELMGISPNAVAALASRAREGLRQEYLQERVVRPRPECRPYASRLARLVRGGLTRRERRRLEGHLDRCTTCAQAHSELASLNERLRSALPLLGAGPLLAGHGLPSASTGIGSSAGAVVSGGVAPGGAAVSGGTAVCAVPAGAAASGCIGSAGVAGAGVLAGAASVAAPVSLGVLSLAPAGVVAGLAITGAAAVFSISSVPPPQADMSSTVPAAVTVDAGDTNAESSGSVADEELAGSEAEDAPADAATDPAAGLDTLDDSTLVGSVGAPAADVMSDRPAEATVQPSAASSPSADGGAAGEPQGQGPSSTGAPGLSATPGRSAAPYGAEQGPSNPATPDPFGAGDGEPAGTPWPTGGPGWTPWWATPTPPGSDADNGTAGDADAATAPADTTSRPGKATGRATPPGGKGLGGLVTPGPGNAGPAASAPGKSGKDGTGHS